MRRGLKYDANCLLDLLFYKNLDVAIDLVGNLQQFQKSIERELQAKNMKVKEIPKLAKGEKIAWSDLVSKRPGTGLSPTLADTLVDLALARDVEKGEPLKITDFG